MANVTQLSDVAPGPLVIDVIQINFRINDTVMTGTPIIDLRRKGIVWM